jgi:hypothetical protein
MVVDPHLEKHLKHFGIDLKDQKKASVPGYTPSVSKNAFRFRRSY